MLTPAVMLLLTNHLTVEIKFLLFIIIYVLPRRSEEPEKRDAMTGGDS